MKNFIKTASIIMSLFVFTVCGNNIFAADTIHKSVQNILTVASKSEVAPTAVNIIRFKDRNFEKAVRESIHKPSGDITGEDVKGVYELYCEGKNIKAIDGIQYFENLRSLSLYDNQIRDISCLSSLTELRFLLLGKNCISDISALDKMNKLEVLSLFFNNITSIEALKGKRYLEHVIIKNNKITDITPLADAKELKELWMENNAIADISVLKNFKKLKVLIAEDNLIEDISPLQGLEYLERIDLERNRITDISALGALKHIKRLDLTSNEITDISALKEHRRLLSFNIFDNNLTDITPIEDLPNLSDYVKKYKEVERTANTILDKIIHESMSDLDKEKAIHDYLVHHVKYKHYYKDYDHETDIKGIHNPYGILINGEGTCDGYASTFRMLLRKAGLEARCVFGVSPNHSHELHPNIFHVWNIVKINDDYYHVDVQKNVTMSMGHTDYFNKSDQEFSAIGYKWNTSRYPECRSSSDKKGFLAISKATIAGTAIVSISLFIAVFLLRRRYRFQA